MRKTSLLLLLLCVAGALTWTGCGGGGSATQFTLHTQLVSPTGHYTDDGFVYTDGFCADTSACTPLGPCNFGSGLATSISAAPTDQHGLRTPTNVCVPANWNLARYQSSSCPITVLNFSMYLNNSETAPLPCHQGALFTAAPSTINDQSPPTAIAFSGSPVASSTYGMPRVDFYDENGNGIGSATATSMAGDGSSVTIATPGCLLAQYSGSYAAIINNINADGTSSAVAGATINTYGNDPPPPPPPPHCNHGICPPQP